MSKLTVERLVSLQRLSEVAISPCGGFCVVTVGRLKDGERSAYTSSLWKIPLDGRPAYRLTQGAWGDRSPAFRNDGALGFLSQRPHPEKKDDETLSQVWILPKDGGEAYPITEEPFGVSSFRFAKHADRMVVLASSLPGVEFSRQREVRQDRKKNGPSALLYKKMPIRFWDHWLPEETPHLLSFDGQGRGRKDWTPKAGGEFRESLLAISPDGRWLAVSEEADSTDGDLDSAWRIFDTHLLATEDTTPPPQGRRLGAEDAVWVLAPVFSPDSQTLAYVRAKRSKTHAENHTLCLLDLQSGDVKTLPVTLDRRLTPVAWLPSDQGLLCVGEDRAASAIWAVHFDGRTTRLSAASIGGTHTDIGLLPPNAKPPTHATPPTASADAGSATTSADAGSATTSADAGSATTSADAGSATTSADAGSATTSTDAGSATTSTDAGSATASTDAGHEALELVGLRSTNFHPPEVFRMPLEASARPTLVTAISGFSEAEGMAIAEREILETPGDGGDPIETLLLRPKGEDSKRPLLLWIHGGPISHWPDGWHWRWNPLAFASQGYVVALPNPRGSTGYGQAFIDGIWQNQWGAACYRDLMAVTDALETKPYVDPGKMVAMGGSFGGYMTNWIGGSTDRFRALVTHASVYDMGLFRGTTDRPAYWDLQMGGIDPFRDTEAIARYSPHSRITRWKTPTLILHGEKDYRVPISESLVLFEALQRLGVKSEFLVFPDEHHWILKPRNIEIWIQTIFRFLQETLDTHDLALQPPSSRQDAPRPSQKAT